MQLAKIDRSIIGGFFVYADGFEALCPWWAVPFVWVYACFTERLPPQRERVESDPEILALLNAAVKSQSGFVIGTRRDDGTLDIQERP